MNPAEARDQLMTMNEELIAASIYLDHLNERLCARMRSTSAESVERKRLNLAAIHADDASESAINSASDFLDAIAKLEEAYMSARTAIRLATANLGDPQPALHLLASPN